MSDYADQIRRLSDLGPRPSGSDAHRALVEEVANEFGALGYVVERDAYSFERWDVTDDSSALRVGDRNIPLSSAWPYSGETGPAGATAPLTLVRGRRKNWKPAAGKIAVIDVRNID